MALVLSMQGVELQVASVEAPTGTLKVATITDPVSGIVVQLPLSVEEAHSFAASLDGRSIVLPPSNGSAPPHGPGPQG